VGSGALLCLGAAVVLLRPSRPEVIGTFTDEDLTEIKRIARAEMRRDVIPDHSLDSIMQLPYALERNRGKRMLMIQANPDGTVDVTISPASGKDDTLGESYHILRGLNGWELKGKGRWLEHLEKRPNKNDGGQPSTGPAVSSDGP